MVQLIDLKIDWYFEHGSIRSDRMCPVLIEEGTCSKREDVCPADLSPRKDTFGCVFAYTYILHKYGRN